MPNEIPEGNALPCPSEAVAESVKAYLWALKEGTLSGLTFENAQKVGGLAFEAQFQIEIRLLNMRELAALNSKPGVVH